MGQQVLKFSSQRPGPDDAWQIGVAGTGPDTFDRPTSVAIAPNGDVFVSTATCPNRSAQRTCGEILEGRKFHQELGKKDPRPASSMSPHDIFVGGSRGWVYVADRRNTGIQVFDQDGKFIAAWKQFGEPSSVFVGGTTPSMWALFSGSDPAEGRTARHRGRQRLERIPQGVHSRPCRPGQLVADTSASGIAADREGSIFAQTLPHTICANTSRSDRPDEVATLNAIARIDGSSCGTMRLRVEKCSQSRTPRTDRKKCTG